MIHFEIHSKFTIFSINVTLNSTITPLVLASGSVQAYQSHSFQLLVLEEDTGHMVFITVLSAARFVVALKVQVTSFCDGFVGLCGTLIFKSP